MSVLADQVTARCVHCAWRTDTPRGAELDEVRAIHELIHPGGTVLVGPPETNGAPVARGTWTREKIIAAIQAWAESHGRPPKSTDWQRTGGLAYPSAPTVASVFGKWSDAIVAAGFDRPVAGGRRAAVPPPAAKPKGHAGGRKPAPVERESAPAQAPEGTSEGTLVELARAVEDADSEWCEAIFVMEAAQERYEKAKGSLAERPTGQALLDQWLQHPRMGEGERRVLRALIELYPEIPTTDELAEMTGYSPTASTIGVILSKLRKLGLVEKGQRRVAEELMEAIEA